jgi:hypothetical protein
MDVLGIRTVAGYRRFEDKMKEADKDIAAGNLVGYDSVEKAFTDMLGEDYARG